MASFGSKRSSPAASWSRRVQRSTIGFNSSTAARPRAPRPLPPVVLAELRGAPGVLNAARGRGGVASGRRLEHLLPPRLVRPGLLHLELLGRAAPHDAERARARVGGEGRRESAAGNGERGRASRDAREVLVRASPGARGERRVNNEDAGPRRRSDTFGYWYRSRVALFARDGTPRRRRRARVALTTTRAFDGRASIGRGGTFLPPSRASSGS